MKGCLALWLWAASCAAQVLHVEDLNTRRIRELDRARTAVICREAIAARPGWKALVFPQIPLGTEPYNHLGGKASFPGSYPVRSATLRAIFMDMASELGEQGFRRVFVIHVHRAGLHNRALDQPSDYFHDVYGGRMSHLWGMVPVIGAWGKAMQPLPDSIKKEDGVSLHGGKVDAGARTVEEALATQAGGVVETQRHQVASVRHITCHQTCAGVGAALGTFATNRPFQQ
jgi:creatinine amidohydrolase/Fe(II)-dependent formamide hydrolase-like protein